MKTKVIAALLAVLTAVGGLNLFQSIQTRLLPKSETPVVSVNLGQLQDRVYSIQTDAYSPAEVMISESFNVKDGENLIISVNHSDVNIETKGSGKAKVTITLTSRNMRRARHRFEEMNFKVYQDGNQVIVESSDRKRSNWRNWNFDFNIDIDVLIPESFNVDMTTSHGDVELGNLFGNVHLSTSHGDVELKVIESDWIEITSSHGSIEAVALLSDKIVLSTSHAGINIDAVVANKFEVSTSHADVEIGQLEARSRITTSHGDIEVALYGHYASTLHTSHGDIELWTDSGYGADLDFKASHIRIDSDITVRGKINHERVEAEMNGGGVLIRARTTHGSVSIRSN